MVNVRETHVDHSIHIGTQISDHSKAQKNPHEKQIKNTTKLHCRDAFIVASREGNSLSTQIIVGDRVTVIIG